MNFGTLVGFFIHLESCCKIPLLLLLYMEQGLTYCIFLLWNRDWHKCYISLITAKTLMAQLINKCSSPTKRFRNKSSSVVACEVVKSWRAWQMKLDQALMLLPGFKSASKASWKYRNIWLLICLINFEIKIQTLCVAMYSICLKKTALKSKHSFNFSN